MPRSAKQERTEQILGELAELGLTLARELAVQARAAEEPEQKVALTEAFQQTSRCVRLTLALDAKLDRDAQRDVREAAREAAALAAEAEAREARIRKATEAANLGPARITPEENQKRRVRAVLNRLIWNEAEGDSEEYDVLMDDLDHRLWEIQDAPGFADLPIEVLAPKLAKDMRLCGDLVLTTHASLPPLRSRGGGPSAERSEEPMAEGANPTHRAQYG